MAKAKTTSTGKAKAAAKTPAIAASAASPKDKPGGKRKARKGIDNLLKLAEHPLVADLLAVGAMAAVAAFADQASHGKASKKAGRKLSSSSRAVKSAGKAAAAAIGQRLLAEIKPAKR